MESMSDLITRLENMDMIYCSLRLIFGRVFLGTVAILLLQGTTARAGDDPPIQQSTNQERGKKADGRVIRFSGLEWRVKSSTRRVGPGSNYFAGGEENVFVDGQDRLHMRITQRDGNWQCAEVISARSFGYGTYRFFLDSNVEHLDPNVVIGLFTWHDSSAFHHREIDVEISRWGDPTNKDAQFVVQPYRQRENIDRFQLPAGLNASTHSFTWKPESVFCQTVAGLATSPAEAKSVLHQHTFTQDIPRPGGENARINLWLMGGKPPADGKDVELVISKFEFAP
jgi:hypothetical protein